MRSPPAGGIESNLSRRYGARPRSNALLGGVTSQWARRPAGDRSQSVVDGETVCETLEVEIEAGVPIDSFGHRAIDRAVFVAY